MGTTQGLEQRPVGSLERKKSAGMKMSFSGAWPEFGNVSIHTSLHDANGHQDYKMFRGSAADHSLGI